MANCGGHSTLQEEELARDAVQSFNDEAQSALFKDPVRTAL